MGIGKGDEVITSQHHYCNRDVSSSRCKTIFVDIKNNLNIDEYKIEKITKNKSNNARSLDGRMCDMEKITKLAKKYNLKIIEDAAHYGFLLQRISCRII